MTAKSLFFNTVNFFLKQEKIIMSELVPAACLALFAAGTVAADPW